MEKEQKMPEEISLKTKLLNILSTSLVFAILLWVTMVNFYLGNSNEMKSTLAEVVIVGFALSVFLFCGAAVLQLVFLKSRCFYGINLALMVLAIFGFVQSNLFVWPANAATVSFISVHTHPWACLIEIVFYVSAIGAICWRKEFRQFLFSNEVKLSFVLVGALLLGFYSNVRTSEESLFQNKWTPAPNEIVYGNKHSELLPMTKFLVSEKSNVMILIVDAYGEDYFEETLQDADSPVREHFKDFTHFSHLLSPVPCTMHAVPTLLTGERLFEGGYFKPVQKNSDVYLGMLRKVYGQGDCLLTRLSENGYKNEVFDTFSNYLYPHNPQLIANSAYIESSGKYVFSNVLADCVIPYSAYLLSPVIVKPNAFHCCNAMIWKLYNTISGNPPQEESKEAAADEDSTPAEPKEKQDATPAEPKEKQKDSAQQIVKREPAPQIFEGEPELEKRYYDCRDNLYYAREAFFLNLQKSDFEKVDSPVFSLVHLFGVHHYHSIEQEDYRRAFYINESRYFNTLLYEFCQNLKELGVYDNSYIIIMGDHGSHRESENRKLNPMILIKKPGQTGESMVDNDEIILMRDIAPTILQDLGIPTVNKQSIWNLTPEEKAERQEYWNRLIVKEQ